MKMMPCKDCGNAISKKATQCPQCGAPQKSKKGCLKILIIVFIILALLAVLGKHTPKGKSSDTSTVNSESEHESAIDSSRDEVVKYFQSRSEPKAKDAIWTSDKIFKVGVIDDGTSRDGYAQYIGEVLAQRGYKKVWIQVIDIVKLKADGDWTKLGEYHMQ